MKQKSSLLAYSILLFFGALFFLAIDIVLAEQISLSNMGLDTFGGPRNINNLAINIMSFLGQVIVFASVLGFMIGGGFLVFAAGDEGRVERGKGLMVASIIGLVITLLAYLIVTLVQSLFYAL